MPNFVRGKRTWTRDRLWTHPTAADLVAVEKDIEDQKKTLARTRKLLAHIKRQLSHEEAT